MVQAPGAKVIKLFSMLIYCHSMVLLSFCVIKQNYHGNHNRMVLNYHSRKFYKIGSVVANIKYRGNLLHYFNLKNCKYPCKLPRYFL